MRKAIRNRPRALRRERSRYSWPGPRRQAPDSWRQARLNLSPFAGSPNLRLRFEFATGGTFDTGNPLTGGVEVSQLAAYELTDGQTITLQTVDQTVHSSIVDVRIRFRSRSEPARRRKHSSGLHLQHAVRNVQPQHDCRSKQPRVCDHDSPAQVASKFLLQLQARGINGYINAVRPNVLILPTGGLVTPGAYSFTGLSGAEVIEGTPGVTGTNVPIPVRADSANYDVSATSVRDAMRTAFAGEFSNGRTASWSAYGQTLRFFKYSVDAVNTTAPVGVSTLRYGDLFGTTNANGAGLGVGVAERAQNNAGAGVFIDDIIIGFAERGEQVINAPQGRNNLAAPPLCPTATTSHALQSE